MMRGPLSPAGASCAHQADPAPRSRAAARRRARSAPRRRRGARATACRGCGSAFPSRNRRAPCRHRRSRRRRRRHGAWKLVWARSEEEMISRQMPTTSCGDSSAGRRASRRRRMSASRAGRMAEPSETADEPGSLARATARLIAARRASRSCRASSILSISPRRSSRVPETGCMARAIAKRGLPCQHPPFAAVSPPGNARRACLKRRRSGWKDCCASGRPSSFRRF